jgi:hypothetical protein
VKNVLRRVRWSLVGGALVGAGITLPPMLIGTNHGELTPAAAILLAAVGVCIHLKTAFAAPKAAAPVSKSAQGRVESPLNVRVMCRVIPALRVNVPRSGGPDVCL